MKMYELHYIVRCELSEKTFWNILWNPHNRVRKNRSAEKVGWQKALRCQEIWEDVRLSDQKWNAFASERATGTCREYENDSATSLSHGAPYPCKKQNIWTPQYIQVFDDGLLDCACWRRPKFEALSPSVARRASRKNVITEGDWKVSEKETSGVVSLDCCILSRVNRGQLQRSLKGIVWYY